MLSKSYIILVLSLSVLCFGCSMTNSTWATRAGNTIDSVAMRPARLAALTYLFKKSYGSWPTSLQDCYYLWGDSIASLLAGQDTSYITIQFIPLNHDTLKVPFSMVPFEVDSVRFQTFSGTLYVVPQDSLRVVMKNVKVGWINDLSSGFYGYESTITVNGQLHFPLGPLDILKVKCFKRGASG